MMMPTVSPTGLNRLTAPQIQAACAVEDPLQCPQILFRDIDELLPGLSFPLPSLLPFLFLSSNHYLCPCPCPCRSRFRNLLRLTSLHFLSS